MDKPLTVTRELRMTHGTARMLDLLADQDGGDASETLRVALALLMLARRAARDGKFLGVAASADALECRFTDFGGRA